MNLICYGDSNTWGYDPRSYFGDRYPAECRWPNLLAEKTGWTIINMGQNGREIPDTLGKIPSNTTSLLLIMLGINDLLQGRSAEDAGRRMETLLSHMDFPLDNTVLIAPPVLIPGEWVSGQYLLEQSRLLSGKYQQCASSVGVRFINAGEWNIPMAYDGVHFSEIGHIRFADFLAEELKKIAE